MNAGKRIKKFPNTVRAGVKVKRDLELSENDLTVEKQMTKAEVLKGGGKAVVKDIRAREKERLDFGMNNQEKIKAQEHGR